MQDKKIIFIIAVLLNIISLYSQSYKNITGLWIDQFAYDWQISHYNKFKGFGIAISLTEDGIGEYWDGNIFDVTETKILENDIIILRLAKEGRPALEVSLKLLTDDIIWVYKSVGTGEVYNYPWYRISGPAKIPIQNAVLNDSRVRLRVKPNLSCDTWGFLNKGDAVKIKDKSEEPFIIDGESWYWYKVETDDYPDGWVYGKYLDIAEGNEGKVNKDASS